MRFRLTSSRARRRGVLIGVIGAILLMVGGCARGNDAGSRAVETTSAERAESGISSPVRDVPATTVRSSSTGYARFQILPHRVIKQQDVSAGSGVRRLSLAVVVPVFPVTRKQMIDVAMATIESRSGQGWQAIRLTFAYNAAEAVPAFGVAEWAPAGNWQDTTSSDASTWNGYQLHQQWSSKVDHPSGCHAPSSTAFVYEHEYNTVSASGASDQTIFASIAAHHEVSSAEVEAAVSAVEAWSFC
jgi:hypothetical protein